MHRKLNFEAVDREMAAVLRAKTPAQRLAIAFGLRRSARIMISSMLKSLHPDWDRQRLESEVSRRMSLGAT